MSGDKAISVAIPFSGGWEEDIMVIARLSDRRLAFQLEETLLEAGFTPQEICLTMGEGDHVSTVQVLMRAVNFSDGTCLLTVHTQTPDDEALARAVLRDCGIDTRSISPVNSLVPVKNTLGDTPLTS